MSEKINNELTRTSSYMLAQRAIADLKTAILQTIVTGPKGGMTNVELGRSLGIYMGHVRHEGHIPRTLLSMLESEGVVEQEAKSKRWKLRSHPSDKK